MRWLAAALVLTTAATPSGCTRTEPAVIDNTCANGEGTWIEDDNGVNEFLEEGTNVRVRLCISDTGKVLSIEVD